jgi:hypothetical protein
VAEIIVSAEVAPKKLSADADGNREEAEDTTSMAEYLKPHLLTTLVAEHGRQKLTEH